MRERTPSADDTPKRAPPAPPREAASADVAGSKTSNEAAATTSPSSVDVRMVASTHNLDDLSVSHPASASSDRQQQQEKHGHTYRSAQTAQDKRSRLSNVINNLRKMVPDSRSGDSPRKEEDDRNSVERNLETLEKYVMTVLNGVIKDEEDDDRDVGRKKETEKGKEPEKLAEDQEDEDSRSPAAKFEPSKPNESRTEAAVFLSEQCEKVESLEHQKLDDRDENLQQGKESSCTGIKNSQETLHDAPSKKKESCKTETVEEEEISKGNKCSSKETKPEDQPVQKTARTEGHDEEKKESKSLGSIIMERLTDHQSEEKANSDVSKEDSREFVSENVELRNVCRDLLNDLLNGINQLIDENSQENEETKTLDTSLEESKDSRSRDFSMTSLHCSLPLDKVASVLQNCQTNELAAPQSPSSPSSSSSSSSSSQVSKSPCKPPSPTVRHLCLYCDRKFLSISLRQRHTERVHQQGGGRRSERNSRKPLQNCQYCSDKCAESLEGLFQHMVGSHGDKYHACVQCSTRYLTREALAGHMSESHGVNVERNLQIQEKMKESSPCKELANQSLRDKTEPSSSPKDRRTEDPDHGISEHRTESILLKPPIIPPKETFSNPGSPEFDSSFYSSVSCNIRENLLHHLDGKLQNSSSSVASTTSSVADSKPQQQPQQQQSFYEHNVNQIQFPIDISLTAATPVYSKEYTNEEYENSSEYAQKPGKSNRSHPRRVSFEKYNFPRKYDGKEQWTCSIKDLSKFDISTQLSLRKKQQLLKERVTLNRLHQIPLLGLSETTDIIQDEQSLDFGQFEEPGNVDEMPSSRNNVEVDQASHCDTMKLMEPKSDASESKSPQTTEFSMEFGNFLRLRKWDEKTSNEAAKKQEIVYAELTGEWSRPRVYICGACASKHVTLKEMEDHKISTHPNVWCSHFEFSGDQRELYKHLFLPGRNMPTAKAKAAILVEKVCTKCSRNCSTLPELHRHMLECGGDQAWLLGLFGNGKKKCKWRPFGSRSRRRRQRGMKRNIQNSQTPRVTTPKEKQPTGPRVRPSDRESIQKMLANLPPKRATRKVMQDSTLRAQGRLRNVQTRSRPRLVGDNSSASRMSRNKAALRNKLLKNAKSIQRNRCRIDNISAVIESVVRNYNTEEKKSSDEKNEEEKPDVEKDAKEKTEKDTREETGLNEKFNRTKIIRGPRVLSKKRNVRTKERMIKSVHQMKKTGNFKAKAKLISRNALQAKADIFEEATGAFKSVKISPKGAEKDVDEVRSATSPAESKSPSSPAKNKSFVQITPKRKRPVDPVASLNASIKAKSQLRTQDGKFARNPNKSMSPQKSPEIRPSVGRPPLKGRNFEASPEFSITRSKLRAVARGKIGDQLPKRTTRLSSDSDKMPTLEPAVQVPSSNEEYVETSVNDLPILSPATPSSSPEKALRGKSLISKNLEDKDSPRKGNEIEGTEAKSEVASDSQEENKDQKQVKTRRAKSDGKNWEKNLESIAKSDVPKERPKSIMKEKLKRKSAPARILNVEEKKTGVTKGSEEASPKKDLRQKKEDGTAKTLETRSNSKTKLDKILDVDAQIKIQNVPFEVKKLIGSDNKEDLLTKLVLTSRAASSKRCLRQSPPKVNPDQGTRKKEATGLRRKSLRNIEKKLEDKVALRDDKLAVEEVNKIQNAVNEVKTAIRGRRSSSLSGENKSAVNASQTSLLEGQSKAETQFTTQNIDNETQSNKRQTRGSVLNNEIDTQSKDTSSELHDESLKKNTSLGKRRGRIKSSNEISDKSNSEVSGLKNEEFVKSSLTEIIDKTNIVEENKTNPDDKGATVSGNNNVAKEKEDQDKNMTKLERSESDSLENTKTIRMNLSLNHLQVETGSSMDSGKENSLETVVCVQKAKVGRPRKSWGARREKTSKRSLNNVIGILTEGMNIPVASQQSVVLTVQTTLDNVNPDETVQNSIQQSNDDNSRPLGVDRSNKSSETSNSVDNLIEETRSSVKKPEESSEQASGVSKDLSIGESVKKIQKVDSSSNDDREQSPANDIILDLSRRKQKGKGSFLEKIVSKIAKRKDALLEGEVGSLLDTAADELTSILDEVGPGFSETAESSAEAKSDVNKPKNEEKVQDSRQKIEENSNDKNCHNSSTISDNSDKKLENEDIKIDEFQADENKKKEELLNKEELPQEIINDTESIDQKKVKDGSVDPSGQRAIDHQVETSEVNAEASSSDLKLKDQTTSVETIRNPNGFLLPTPENASESTLNCSAQVCSTKQDDKSAKEDQETVSKESKLKKKLKKRSLERNSPKKSKRKSTEPTESSEENVFPEELHLADIMKLIDKSKQVPCTKENVDDSSSEVTIERILPGKRKTVNDDSEMKDSSSSKATDDVQTTEDSVDSVKKIKMDTAKNAAEHASMNAEDKLVFERSSIEDSIKETNETPVNNEEKHSSLLQTTEKPDKCLDKTVKQCPEIETPVRRSSKRRSLLEEKVVQLSEEEASSKIEPSLNVVTAEASKRKSSRTRFMVQSKTEDKVQKESQNDPASSTSDSVVADNSESLSKISTEDSESSKSDASSMQTEDTNKAGENSTSISTEKQETCKAEDVKGNPEDNLKESQKALDIPVVPKVLKKRGRKKKVQSNEQVTSEHPRTNSNSKVETEAVVSDEVFSRKSLRTSRANEEIEERNKNSSSMVSSSITSPSLEHFKIPEVTEVLQHTKKRTSKKKSTIDEHPDAQSNALSSDSDVHSVESLETNRTFVEKVEQSENKEQKESSESRKRSSRGSKKEQLDLERSSSSGSIDLAQSSRTRSSKRKQLSSEDLLSQESLNHRAESVDSLSETSVVSESSYFRKKRFSKKKKGFQKPPEDVQTDTSITDSESADTERTTDRRQSLKRRAKKNISFFEVQFDLVDDFDIPMDIEECLEPESTLKDTNQELESKSSIVEDKIVEDEIVEDKIVEDKIVEDKIVEEKVVEDKIEDDKIVEDETILNETSNGGDEEKPTEQNETVAELKQSLDDEDERPEETKNVDDKAETSPEVQEDFQAPKKRGAGNFVVVHKKTGEILIVEKRKKLTKEAAKFFCDVCTTSFTRKSSLKKHNLSQSHLLQLAKSKKDKGYSDSTEEACDADWKESSSQNETSSEENKSVTDSSLNIAEESKEDQRDSESNLEDTRSDQNDSSCRASTEEESLITSETTRQRIVEDQLLDEEICKITENMSHDEYVLTEHISPESECMSTPVKIDAKKTEDVSKKKKHEKKKEKAKKKNSIEKHLTLDTPEPEIHMDSTSGSRLSVLGSNMCIKISKSSYLNAPEPSTKEKDVSGSTEDISSLVDSSSNLESRNSISTLKQRNFQKYSEPQVFDADASVLEKNETMDMEVENARKGMDLEKGQNMEVEVESKKAEDIPRSVSRGNQPHERLSLKLTINKRNIEQFREDKDLASPKEIEDTESLDSYSNQCNVQEESIEDATRSKPKTGQLSADFNSVLFKNLKKGNRRSVHTVENSNVSKEINIIENLEEDNTKTNQVIVDNSPDQQALTISENKLKNTPDLQCESIKTTKHGKSKRNKTKKHNDEAKNILIDSSATWKVFKSKSNLIEQTLDEVAKLPDTVKNQELSEYPETFDCKIIDTVEEEKSKFLANNSSEMNNLSNIAEPENEADYNSNALEGQKRLYLDLEISDGILKEKTVEEKEDNINSEDKLKSLLSVEEDEASSSSLEDKPLSQILLRVDEKLEADKKQEKVRGASLNLLKKPEDSKPEETEDPDSKVQPDADETSVINNQQLNNKESISDEQIGSQIVSEGEYEPERLKPAEDSNKDAKNSSESDDNETVSRVKSVPSDKEVKVVSSDRKSSSKRVSKSRKHSNKECHRKSRSKKASLKSKIANLTSESDDSEGEDKIESQNKSKIVKSVFGRVFGGEKTDKVKEVLNDWVSKSEDDSDVSRAELRSSNSTELESRDITGHRSEKKSAKKQLNSTSIPSSPKKRSGRKSKRSSSSDRTKEKNPSAEGQEDHHSSKRTESRNSSNNHKRSDTNEEDYCYGVLPPTSYRTSKKRAEERISKSFLSLEYVYETKEGNYNWISKSEDDSGVSRTDCRFSSPNEPRTREISEARCEEKSAERQINPISIPSTPKKRSEKKSKKTSSSDRIKEKNPLSENSDDYHSGKRAESRNSSSNRKRNDIEAEDYSYGVLPPTSCRTSKKKAEERISKSFLPLDYMYEPKETNYGWVSKSEDESNASRTEFRSTSPNELKSKEVSEAGCEEKRMEMRANSPSVSSSSKKRSGKKSRKNSSLDRGKQKGAAENLEDHHSGKHVESKSKSNNGKRSDVEVEDCYGVAPPTRTSKKKAEERISKSFLPIDYAYEPKETNCDWASKSEDESNASRSEFRSISPNELKSTEVYEARNEEKNVERQSNSSPPISGPKKRSGRKSKKSSSLDRSKEKNPKFEGQEDQPSNEHTESKNNSSNRKRSDVNAEDCCYDILPSTNYRTSKKRAEERISKAFLPLDGMYESKEASESRNQSVSDLTIKDSSCRSFNYGEEPSKLASLENSTDEDRKVTKKRKSSDLQMEKKNLKSNKESDDEDDCSIKDSSSIKEASPKRDTLSQRLSIDQESSHSYTSLAPSSVRNRSPSMDRNSQSTRDSNVDDEEERDEEEIGHRRISPLFVYGTPRSSIDSSSNSENEEEDENVATTETTTRKRSSSEFSGEKIVIRSPSSTHKTEVVTIAPTDAIEDNALDVPQEIEESKPRQGKVLNFDEELFVECCSRLKATTENELRGAKKIKLDHSEGYHRKDDQQQGFRGPRDRWRDVESQNSLGSLLESVNQLLGEEMYSTRERDYPKRSSRNLRSEQSSRSASPDMSRVDNLGYEDSLDVAFEHNNKLRDKIQQRMRESENLIASTFGQKSSNEVVNGEHPPKTDEQETLRNSYIHPQDQEHLSEANLSNGDYNDALNVRDPQEQQNTRKMNVDSSGFKSKMNSALTRQGLLDKALSNLLHSNGKHDHNGSTPMKVLAELACARAPTSTTGDSTSQEDIQPVKISLNKDSTPNPAPLTISKDLQKKTRNPIKELFERKKEMNERKQQEKSKAEVALRELNVHRQRKTRKTKKHQDFPLIRRNEHGGLAERKKRRDGFERKEEFVSDRIKDVYEFDEEESQMEPNLGSVMSYRSRPGYEVSCLRTKEVDVAGLMSKAIGDSLENGKTGDALSTRLESMIDRKFKELEKFAPKTKGALKAFQSEEQQRHVTGPMDDFVERKQPQSKRPPEQNLKHSKLKKRCKNPKKKTRNAWYENDSSDEYRTAVKTEDVGVGISKSQRTCSKGKQNIFAELYTSSESEFEDESLDYEAKKQRKVKKGSKKVQELENVEQDQVLINKYSSENEDRVDEWRNQDLKNDTNKNDCDNKKSESEMSDHPLIIDERKDVDDQRNSDDETENQYERNFGLDDLYREDSSVVDSDVEESTITKSQNVTDEFKVKNPNLSQEKLNDKTNYIQEDELIPLEEALDLLDQPDTNLGTKYDNINKEVKHVDQHNNTIMPTKVVNETFNSIQESTRNCPNSVEDQEEEPDNDLLALPEKLSTNEKPQKESENLPLHVFLSRKVQESKKRKEQQLKKMQEEQERILMDFQPTRRQRKCAIGKQGLLAEISSSDEEISPKDSRKANDRSDHEKPRKQKRESKEKRKERYIEKKHEQMIAKEQKAIEEEILRELGKKKESFTQNTVDGKVNSITIKEAESAELQEKTVQEQVQKKHQVKEKQKKLSKLEDDICAKNNNEGLSDFENNCSKSAEPETHHESENNQESHGKQKKHSKSPTKPKKTLKGDTKTTTGRRGKNLNADKKNRADSKGSKDKERRSSSGKRDSDDEELKTTKSWNKVEEGVGVAIGRRKRAAANQLYYWSSSSDEEEMLEVVPAIEEEEDDRQEQHGWIVGDSHKRMITMLAMEKQLKEKRRRSEDEFEPGKAKSKKHRNSTS